MEARHATPSYPTAEDQPDPLRDVEGLGVQIRPPLPVVAEESTFLEEVLEHLLDEKWIALGLAVDDGRQLARGGPPSAARISVTSPSGSRLSASLRASRCRVNVSSVLGNGRATSRST